MILHFDAFEVSKNPISHKLFHETSNGAFCLSYSESRLICKFDLNSEILDFARLEVTKKLLFHKSSRKFQMVRSFLVTQRAE